MKAQTKNRKCQQEGCKYQERSRAEMVTHLYDKHGMLLDGSNTIFRWGDELDSAEWRNEKQCPIETCRYEAKHEAQLIQHCAHRHVVTGINRSLFQHCSNCHILRKLDMNWESHKKLKHA